MKLVNVNDLEPKNQRPSPARGQEEEQKQWLVDEAVDGLAEYQKHLPLSRIKYSDFMIALKAITASPQLSQVSSELQQQLKKNPDWQNDETSEHDIQKLFDSSLLRDKGDQEKVSWLAAKLVGLFTCRHGSGKKRRYLIANLVANETTSTEEMQADRFVDAIRPILRLAAIDFTRAVFETKFMDALYDDTHYQMLEAGIEKVCEGIRQEVFEGATEIDQKQWVYKAMSPDFEWLYKFETIRKRVHKASDVPLLHINDREAKKSLISEVDRLREEILRLQESNKMKDQEIFKKNILLKQVELIIPTVKRSAQ